MGTTSTISSVENLIITILAIVVIIIFGWAIYTFLVAIFQFIFSKWDAEKVKKAWNNIRYMILGILFSIILLFIFPLVVKRLEIPWYKNYTAKNIFSKATNLFKIFKKDATINNNDIDNQVDIPSDAKKWEYIEL